MQFRSFFPLPSQTNAIARLKIMHFPLSLRSSARLFCCPNYALTESALKNSYNWCMPVAVSERLRPCAKKRPANLFLKSCKTQKTQQAEWFRLLRINTGHTDGGSPYIRKNDLIRFYQSEPTVCQLLRTFAAFQCLRFFLQRAVFLLRRGDLRLKLRSLFNSVFQIFLNTYQAQDSIYGQRREHQSHQSRCPLHYVRPRSFFLHF